VISQYPTHLLICHSFLDIYIIGVFENIYKYVLKYINFIIINVIQEVDPIVSKKLKIKNNKYVVAYYYIKCKPDPEKPILSL
jgi:hypothetical protein